MTPPKSMKADVSIGTLAKRGPGVVRAATFIGGRCCKISINELLVRRQRGLSQSGIVTESSVREKRNRDCCDEGSDNQNVFRDRFHSRKRVATPNDP